MSTPETNGAPMDPAEKSKALDTAMKQLEKNYGKGVIMRLGDRAREAVPSISTGALTLDLALGVGGVPRGRVIEIYGPESSGKTTLTLHIIAQSQKQGGYAAFVDAEHALDPVYANKLGVDIENLVISQPDSGEQALEITEALVRSGAVDVVVVDSVAALTPRAEIDGNMGDAQMGAQARLMSQALRKLTAIVNRTGTTVVFINQLRQKIGVMFGNPETTTGGNALKFYASVRMDIRRTESLKNGDEVYGNHVKVKVVKNKVAPPFRIAEFDILFNHGISRESCILEAGLAYGVLKKSGTWWSYGDERIGQGRENARQFLVDNADMADAIESEVREAAAAKEGKIPAKNDKAAKADKEEAAAKP